MQTGLTATITAFEGLHKLLSIGIHKEKYLEYCENMKFEEVLNGVKSVKTPFNTRKCIICLDDGEFWLGPVKEYKGLIKFMRDQFINQGIYTAEEINKLLSRKWTNEAKLHKLENLVQETVLSKFHEKYLTEYSRK